MKQSLYILTAFSLMLLGSCLRDNVRKPGFGGDELQLTLEVKKLSAPTATRAQTVPAEEGEDRISSLYLLFFTADVHQNGMLVDYVDVGNVTGMSADVDLSGTSLDAANAYEILALANVADNRYISDGSAGIAIGAWLQRWAGKRQSQVMLEANALVAGASDDSNAISPDQLLMSAMVSKPAGQSKINMLLTRDLVRFDVYNTQKAGYDLVSASIWNAYPETSIWSNAATMDYSAHAARISRFYGVDNSANSDVRDGEPTGDEVLNDIVGGLYAFENRVVNPAGNDKITTCLIVGLRDRAEGTTSYYRANMNSAAAPQTLIRNHVYSLTITGVVTEGYASEEMAYNGKGNGLLYTVGEWNMDDNGLIVQDENSIISLPAKTINIGRNGGDFDYSLFINSKLPNPGNLAIVNQMWEPADNGIDASINGNIVHLRATPLALDQTERRGIISLQYAGLQTTMNVVQSGEAETFLNVTLPEGGIPVFQPFANLSSGYIDIEASGSWTAKIYMAGFSFTEGRAVTEITSEDVTNNHFRIYTNTANPEDRTRQGFVVVTLDSDPENYSAVIRVAQKAPGIIRLNPDQGVVNFNVDASLFDPLPPAKNVNEFNVLPNKLDSEDGQTQYIPEWKAEIIQSGMYDDRSMFKITTQQQDADVDANNILVVDAVGPNYLGRTATAVVRVSLTNEPGTYADITLNQTSFTWNVPFYQGLIPSKGGVTDELKITLSEEVPNIHYTVAIQSFEPVANYGVGPDKQFAYLIDGGDPTETPYSSLLANDTSVGFRVGFPSLTMQSVDLESEVTIAVTLVETGETRTFSVSQSKFVPRPVNVLDIGAWRHGNLVYLGNNNSTSWYTGTDNFDATYQENLAILFENANYFGPDGTVKTNGPIGTGVWRSGTATWDALKSTVSFVNYTSPAYDPNQFANGYVWDWLHTDSGFTLINSEGGNAEGTLDYTSYIPGQLGLSGGGGYRNVASVSDWNTTGGDGFRINPDDTNPVIDYLVHSGPFGEVSGWQNLNIGNSGTNGYTLVSSIEPALGKDAVSVLQMISTDPNDATGELVSELVIDPSLNLMIKNDSELYFDDPGYYAQPDEQPRLIFSLNLAAFMINTAQYGSLFTNGFWDAPYDVKTMPEPQQ